MSTTASLAQQALNNLVNQFARPMDFLRELVQNAIDAGSPRVEVWVRRRALEGGGKLVEIHVDDYGEGMDEYIIDEKLTRMFASTKEDDLTKIGRFGIGFTSIFAIEPEAVLLHTGRHGEFWELLFHKDRTFDKVRVERPVDGTRITLFKHVPAREVDRFVQECRWILRYWCEHSTTPITFWDQGEDETAPAALATDDPFAAFAAPSAWGGPEPITGPLDLEVDLLVRRVEGGIEALIGYAARPRYGFYNGGLTLLNTHSSEVLGEYAARLGHLSFKVRSDGLEHTLTRDNVLQDEHWHKVMEVLVAAARQLQEELLARLERAAAAGEALLPWLRYLALDCQADPEIGQIEKLYERILLPDREGRVLTLKAVDQQLGKTGIVLLDPGEGPLRDALEAAGMRLLPDAAELRGLLRAAPRPHSWLRRERAYSAADRVFVLPQIVPRERLPGREQALLQGCDALLKEAAGGRVRLEAGEYGGPARAGEEPLALCGDPGAGFFARPDPEALRLPLFLKRRCLLVNRHHPLYQAQLTAAGASPVLAAYGLVQALLHGDGVESERIFRRLLAAAHAALQEPIPRLTAAPGKAPVAAKVQEASAKR